MMKRAWLIGAAAAVALVGLAVATRGLWSPDGAVAQSTPQGQGASRTFPVETATAIKKPMPVRFDELGTITPMASVVVKPRVDSEITGVHFADGALVRQGDLLFTLDGRSIEAQIRQVEAVITGAKAQQEQAERDVQRYTDLVAKNATPITNLDNAKTQVNIFRAVAESNTAQRENLQVQLGYCTIRAPITGKISAATVKVGNFVRAGSDQTQLATINQISPIYISFGVPQRILPQVRQAIDAGTATVDAIVPGEERRARGKLSMIENTVDATSGMVTLRATMENTDQVLWPGALVKTLLSLRIEDSVTVPSVAVQTSQTGTFVYVVKNQTAVVRPVVVGRVVDNETVIDKGLDDGETIVVDGQLLLSNNVKVAPRPKVGS
jgi:RND family efflux transporter MFP subunit